MALHSMTPRELHACRCEAVNFARCKRDVTEAPSVTCVRQFSLASSTRPHISAQMPCGTMRFVEFVVLAGGVGGARFLRGLRSAAPEAAITAVVNTGDDVTMHGLRICPDLDTVVYTLGGAIDEERGWGRAGETWTVKDELAGYGAEPTWFGLGDRDLATHLVRTRMLDAGYPLSQVTEALAAADAVLLAPSNPVVSIGTILGVPGMREALLATPGKVVGVSPIVGGAVVRGMADRCLPVLGIEVSAEGVGRHYGARADGGLLDAWLVAPDDSADVPGVDVRRVPLLMSDPETTAALARAALDAAGA